MRIDVIQTENTGVNKFEIQYNGVLKYTAKLPFISISEPLNLEKMRATQILDLNGNPIYTTDYKYVENLKEEIVPLKYLATGSQKFNQLLFVSEEKTIKIYYEENGLSNNRRVIEMDGKTFSCYSIEDGYIRHLPIYDGDIQIGEALKPNVIRDGKDEYCCFLKNEYEFLADGIVSLLLYLDRSEYNSSYLVNKSIRLSKYFSYNKTNKFYDKEWVKNNFGDAYLKKVEEDVAIAKEKLAHPIQTNKELIASMNPNEKNLMKLIILLPWVLIGIFFLVVVLTFLLFS